ncbi:MAG: translation initiation factor IF-3 [Patescibacteria group bacterium]
MVIPQNLIINDKNISKHTRLNHQIRVPQVRVIDDQGEQLGVVDTYRALQIARDKGLDLVEVSPIANPPVCRIMDYGAYLYQQEKKEKKQKAKQKKVEIKGIRLSLKIGPHDLELRKDQAVKFLNKGHKAKIELILRGRERAHADRAREIMKNFADSLTASTQAYIEKGTTQQGGRMFMIVGKKS